jgi:formylglycine-generating enzyme required for sulfatase activity
MRLYPLILLGLFAWLACLMPAQAVSAGSSAKRVALLIGNAKYRQTSLNLKNPVNDTQLLAQVLDKELGFTVRTEANLDVNDMDRVLTEFYRAAQGADVVLLYYAGHGMKGPDGTSFLLPVDVDIGHGKARELERQAVAAARVRDNLEKIGARIGLLILDACRDGPVRGGRSADRGLTYVGGRERLLVAYAAQESKVAEDGEGDNGPYARALAVAFKQNKPVLEQLDDVADAVEKETRDRQKPTREGDLRTNAYLLPEQAETLKRQHAEDWNLCKTGLSVTPCEQYRRKHPQGVYFEQAGTRIADIRAAERSVVAATPGKPVVGGSLTTGTWDTGIKTETQPVAKRLQPGQVIKDCDVCPELVVIPGGQFLMGDDWSAYEGEKPAHRVTVAGFLLGKVEVTQEQWRALMGSNPSYFKDCGDTCPVEQVSWQDVQTYLKKLSEKSGQQYRLPSEAEWEYAARADTTTAYPWGQQASHEQANYGKEECCVGLASGRDKWINTAPVGSFPANQFGLYDMHGNVAEWVEDCFHDSYQGAPSDGWVWAQGCNSESRRVLRGGTFDYSPYYIRSAYRFPIAPTFRSYSVGVRVARGTL